MSSTAAILLGKLSGLVAFCELLSPKPSPSLSVHCVGSFGHKSAPNDSSHIPEGSDEPSPSVSGHPNLSLNEVPKTYLQASPSIISEELSPYPSLS